MNEAPKELTGRELWRHCAELEAAVERGDAIQFWDEDHWTAGGNLGFFQHPWQYRVKPKPREWWVNVYATGANAYRTRNKADEMASYQRLACVRVTEGQFDE